MNGIDETNKICYNYDVDFGYFSPRCDCFHGTALIDTEDLA